MSDKLWSWALLCEVCPQNTTEADLLPLYFSHMTPAQEDLVRRYRPDLLANKETKEEGVL